MADKYPVFLRPVVISASNKDFAYNAAPLALTTGTYPNVLAVLKEIETKTVNVSASLDSNFKVILDGGATFTITWTDSALRDLLGFTGNLSGNDTYTATYTPENCWVPSRSRSDTNEWVLDHKAQWAGLESKAGNVAGLRTGIEIYRTSFEFEALASGEVLQSQATSLIAAQRTLDYFIAQSRVVWGEPDAPSPSGFYVYHDRSLCAPAVSATWTSGDAGKLNYTSSPDTFVFAAFDPKWMPKPKQTLSVRAAFTNVDVDIHSATAPTWTGA